MIRRALNQSLLESSDGRVELVDRQRPLANELIENLTRNRRQRVSRTKVFRRGRAWILFMVCPAHKISDTLIELDLRA